MLATFASASAASDDDKEGNALFVGFLYVFDFIIYFSIVDRIFAALMVYYTLNYMFDKTMVLFIFKIRIPTIYNHLLIDVIIATTSIRICLL